MIGSIRLDLEDASVWHTLPGVILAADRVPVLGRMPHRTGIGADASEG